MVAKKPTPKKTTGRKMSPAQDHKFDKKFGIKDGSPLDVLLDAKVVAKPKGRKPAPKKK